MANENIVNYLEQISNLKLKLLYTDLSNLNDKTCQNGVLVVNQQHLDLLNLQIHKLIIAKIIHSFFFKNYHFKLLSNYFCCFKENEDSFSLLSDIDFRKILQNLTIKEVLLLLDKLHYNYLTTQAFFKNDNLVYEKSKSQIKAKGTVYTPHDLTKQITIRTIKNRFKQNSDINNLRLLDFGCGTGRFYLEALDYLGTKLKFPIRELICNNLFAIDLDPLAIDILKINAYFKLKSRKISDMEFISKNIIAKNMLTVNSTDKPNKDNVNYYLDFKEVMLHGGFNIIISNPPYLVLKPNNLDSTENIGLISLKEQIRLECDVFRKSGVYIYALEGMLNYYKLAIEMMLNIAAKDAELGIICPSTLFADISSTKLRKYLLLQNTLREIYYFSGSSRLFEDVNQALCIFYLKKGDITDNIKIHNSKKSFNVNLDLISACFPQNYELPSLQGRGWNIIKKMSKFKKLKEFPHIKNKRGEFDLTLFKPLITTKNTGWNLIRGDMLLKEGINYTDNEFVTIEPFLKKKSSEYISNAFNRKRLVCHQISNLEIKKRLNFIFCNEKDILANSCNYLFTDNIKELSSLREILSSYLLNWRFKITSTNNHINNYELAELPIVTLNEDITHFEDLAKNIYISKLFGLNKEEVTFILKDYFPKEEIDVKWKELT